MAPRPSVLDEAPLVRAAADSAFSTGRAFLAGSALAFRAFPLRAEASVPAAVEAFAEAGRPSAALEERAFPAGSALAFRTVPLPAEASVPAAVERFAGAVRPSAALDEVAFPAGSALAFRTVPLPAEASVPAAVERFAGAVRPSAALEELAFPAGLALALTFAAGRVSAAGAAPLLPAVAFAGREGASVLAAFAGDATVLPPPALTFRAAEALRAEPPLAAVFPAEGSSAAWAGAAAAARSLASVFPLALRAGRSAVFPVVAKAVSEGIVVHERRGGK